MDWKDERVEKEDQTESEANKEMLKHWAQLVTEKWEPS